jgi:uncharacterized protein
MTMRNLKEFQIAHVGLKLGHHLIDFDIENQFFSHFPDSPISQCAVKVKLELEKKETLFVLKFFIDGSVQTSCDRCLEPFNKDVFGDYICIVKYSEELSKGENDDDEIIYISPEEPFIEVAQLIYEYICLSLPMQLLGCKEPGQGDTCNRTVLDRLEGLDGHHTPTDENDPRWAGLKKLKFD